MAPIISLFLFLVIARATTRFRLGIILPSAIVVGVPFVVNTFIKFLMYGNSNLPIENIISFRSVSLGVLQFVVALFVFRRLDQADDSIVDWLVWVGAGAFVIVFMLPAILG